jgi:hypothetical protein
VNKATETNPIDMMDHPLTLPSPDPADPAELDPTVSKNNFKEIF